jgi:hypothetical protein
MVAASDPGREDECRFRVLVPVQLSQRPQFIAANLMRCRLTVLLARDVHGRAIEVDRVSEGDADHGKLLAFCQLALPG